MYVTAVLVVLALVIPIASPAASPADRIVSWSDAVARLEDTSGVALGEAASLGPGLAGAPNRARLTLDALDVCYDDPLLLVDMERKITAGLSSRCGDLTALLHHAFTLAGNSAGGYGPPLRGAASGAATAFLGEDLESVVVRLSRPSAAGGIGLEIPAGARRNWDGLDEDVRRLALGLMACCAEFQPLIDGFVDREGVARAAGLPDDADAHRLHEFLARPWNTRDLRTDAQVSLFEAADPRLLAYASRLLLEGISAAVRQYRDSAADPAAVFEPCLLESELGAIGIFGGGDDAVTGDFFLVMDTGGDDRYTGRVASSLGLDRPLGLSIDLDGNDIYGDLESPLNLACGVLGVGVLWDLGGDDLYRCGGTGLAYALGGTAVLLDASGTDTYESAGDGSQGAATLGVAMLVDRRGVDTYRCGNRSQGFGGTRGAGLLVDCAGDDSYAGRDDGENGRDISFVQGAGLGLWHGAADGLNLGGGIGVLVDGGGDDSYRATGFAQGAAYYRGLGILADLDGNDTYDARSHSQGAAAHYGLACFRDGGGDDRYNEGSDRERITQMMGCGRDLSAAFFVDDAGDDSYVFGNRCAGTGDLGATGVFWDAGGDDEYVWCLNGVYAGDRSLGSAQAAGAGMSKGFRPFEPSTILTLGAFLDSGGTDTYRTAGGEAGGGAGLPENGSAEAIAADPHRLRITVDTER